MSDDRTVQLSTFFPVRVRVEKGIVKEREHTFTSTFRIGRSPDCELHLMDRSVSKTHVEVQFEQRQWWVQDLESRNGTYLDGTPIQRERLPDQARLELGIGGPILHVTVDYLLEVQEESRIQAQTPTSFPPEVEQMVDSPSSGLDESHQVLESSVDVDRQLIDAQQFAKEAGPHPIEPELSDIPSDSLLQESVVNPPSEDQTDSPDHPEQDQAAPSQRTSAPDTKFSSSSPSQQSGSLTQIIRRTLDKSSSGMAGPETLFIIRDEVKKVLKRHSKRYLVVIGIVGGISVLLGGIAWFQYLQVQNLKTLAADMFYSMKTIELQLAQLEDTILEHLPPGQMEQMLKRQEDFQTMQRKAEQEYERFLEELGIYSKDMSEQDRTILRMARLFGECEVEIPEDFVEEVERYIKQWQSTKRLHHALARAKSQGYGVKVVRAMIDQNMPPEFFYLALQESNFKIRAVGPKTRFGIAKGPWQFIPSTAVQYGLRIGPLVDVPRYDPKDERHNFEKATRAAARYLKDIYRTEAQASGLLVMASYNWGQTRVRKLIHQLPKNPKERNFWKLLRQFKIPKETYNYVFYIFSAAVIAENPQLFGFDFENPLVNVEKGPST